MCQLRCYIGLGSNLGDRQKNIDEAVRRLGSARGIEVKRVSSVYETEPVGGPPQGKYLNAVAEIETGLSPRELLTVTQAIEDGLGRTRTVRNGPRTIDLDILLCGGLEIDEPDLKIPHPRMKEREFVMKGLRELVDEGI
ncbi:MAG: 2-amino-4-hydroxy-6-hydroxymethyldihydropteridine diphosphokinase [Candidatus Omnitrophota bacterium]